jgi:hypothetical protein
VINYANDHPMTCRGLRLGPYDEMQCPIVDMISTCCLGVEAFFCGSSSVLESCGLSSVLERMCTWFSSSLLSPSGVQCTHWVFAAGSSRCTFFTSLSASVLGLHAHRQTWLQTEALPAFRNTGGNQWVQHKSLTAIASSTFGNSVGPDQRTRSTHRRELRLS